uniref:Uncharacterized protein n=1 Tax=Aegilops tauschii subsp. strangulata TaxID=200361 RepID=A0A453MND7_AEGTS
RLAAVPRNLSIDPISHHPTPRPLQILRPPARPPEVSTCTSRSAWSSDWLVGAALVRRSRIQPAWSPSGVARSDCGW